MRLLISILWLSLVATSSLATVDPDSDQIGVYFDLEANNNCTTADTLTPFFAYVIITNPSAPEVHGLEFSYHLAVPPGFEEQIFRLQNGPPCKCVDLGQGQGVLDGEYVRGLATPEPGNGANVIFITWQFLMLAEFTIDFYLGPTSVSSNDSGLPNYEAGGYILPLGVSSGDIRLPVASVNGDCRAIPDDAVTFGHVKSLYR